MLDLYAQYWSETSTIGCNFYRNEFRYPLKQEVYLNGEKSLMYVAISRAIKILRITGTGVKSDVVQV